MSTREGLLTAITTNPGDDTPRLVYADYLDESGDPDDAARAKLIRTQIEASRLPSGDKSRAELEQLAEELWERYQTTWFVGVEPSRLPFPERGFITHWGCYSAEEIAADLRVTFQREPIISLTLSVSDPQELAGVETEPALARVQELSVWPGTTDDEVLFRFFSSPYLCGLRKLSIMGNWRRPWSPMPETVRVLATRPQYTSLREFDLTHADVGNSGASALAGSKILRLTSLSIGRCDIGMDGLRTVLASPVVSHLTSLGLGGDAGTAAEAEILADALATSAHLGQLEGLGIDETAFTDSAAARLARADWPALNRLTILPHNHTHSDQVTGLPTMTAQGDRESPQRVLGAEHRVAGPQRSIARRCWGRNVGSSEAVSPAPAAHADGYGFHLGRFEGTDGSLCPATRTLSTGAEPNRGSWREGYRRCQLARNGHGTSECEL